MFLSGITNVLKSSNFKIDHKLNALKLLVDLMRSKCNQVFIIFLKDNGTLKEILNLATFCKQIKDKQIDEMKLFPRVSPEDRTKRQEFIDLMLKSISEWHSQLGKDHSGKCTYFLMLYKAIMNPEEITVDIDSPNLQDTFHPTEKDSLIQRYTKFCAEYEEAMEYAMNTPADANAQAKSRAEEFIERATQRGSDLYKALKEVAKLTEAYGTAKTYTEQMVRELGGRSTVFSQQQSHGHFNDGGYSEDPSKYISNKGKKFM